MLYYQRNQKFYFVMLAYLQVKTNHVSVIYVVPVPIYYFILIPSYQYTSYNYIEFVIINLITMDSRTFLKAFC